MDHSSLIPKLQKVSLGFKPETARDVVIHEIFSDRVSRNLWLGIKAGHLTSVHFNEDCLRLAEQIRRTPPQTSEDVLSIFAEHGRDPVFRAAFNRGIVKLAEEMFPYIAGPLDFSYEVL